MQAALAQAQRAMREVTNAEDQSFEVDLQAGRARTIIKKSGFADVLQRKNCVGIKITESNIQTNIHILQLDTLRPFLEDLISLLHWTNNL